MELFKLYGNITKVEDGENDTVIVSGVASSEIVDSDGEIITADAMRGAIPEYMKFGNIREMHQPIAAGTAINCYVGEDGKTYLEALIVDSNSVKKVRSRVLKAFSIGGKIVEKAKNIISKIKLVEISLVDRPANPEAVIGLVKMEDCVPEEAEKHEEPQIEQAESQSVVEKAEVPEEKAENKAENATDCDCNKTVCDCDAEKIGAKHSRRTKSAIKSIKQKLGEINEVMKELDLDEEDVEEECKSENVEDIKKAADIEKSELKSEIEKLSKALNEANAKLAEKPLRYVAVSKEEDGKIAKQEAKKAMPTDPYEAMKFIHGTGGSKQLTRLG